tara:strand:- start:607 stop:1026 length:420 start_codon:yes stop_codon:yes gene_type:complete
MFLEPLQNTLVGLGISEYRIDSKTILDETSYKNSIQKVVGVTTDTGESILGDMTIDWTTFKNKYDEELVKYPMTLLRLERNVKILNTDWSQLDDVPAGIKTAYQSYRQALRDLPANASPKLDDDGNLDQSSFTWPTEPS